MVLPSFEFDFIDDLDALAEGSIAGPQTVLQLSSTVIRISQPLWGVFQPIDYEFKLTGSGIGPVSSLSALMNAIDQGFATGSLNKLEVLNAGVTVAQVTMNSGGYVFSTGGQSMSFDGTLPLSFAQFSDLASLFVLSEGLFTMTAQERQTLFNDLSAYGVTGFGIADGSNELFSISITANLASLTLNGLTFSATGTFPNNFGGDADLLYQIALQFNQTGTVDINLLSNLSVTRLDILDALGNTVGSVANPTSGTPLTWAVDGKAFDEVEIDVSGGGVLYSGPGTTRSALAGLAGDDFIFGGGGRDYLLGGSGKDQLSGGSSADRLNGGAGRDILTGGSGGDVFVFTRRAGIDHITDFAVGVDVIEIRAANRMRDLTFTKVGLDVEIDFGTIHIVVENVAMSALRDPGNFLF